MKRVTLFLLTIIIGQFFSPLAFGLSVKSLNLNQLVGFSDRIFRGKLVDTQVADDRDESGMLVKYYSFDVDECIKGICGKSITIKQVANPRLGLPDYEKGATYLLFLPPDSERTGLVAPVGVWQGQYELVKKDGKWTMPTMSQNVGLTRSLTKSLSTENADVSSYDSFKKLIQTEIDKGGN